MADIVVTDLTSLQSCKDNLTGNHTLANDLDLTGLLNGSGFTPIGTVATPFSGTFNGNGHKIIGLMINRSSTDGVGLFGGLSGDISNVTLQNCSIVGGLYTGSICGNLLSGGSIDNCSSSGSVTGSTYTGGVCGLTATSSQISNCLTTCEVHGVSNCGGFIGRNYSTIVNCSSSGDVYGTLRVGGFCGRNYSNTAIIQYCYSLGNVISINTSGNNENGGFCGFNENTAIINDCYSFGNVSGYSSIGGFVGSNSTNSPQILRCYSLGTPSGTSSVNGFCGTSFAVETNCFYNSDSGFSDTGNGTPKTPAELKLQATFTNWDFSTIWRINSSNNSGYPYLAWQTFGGSNPVGFSGLLNSRLLDGNLVK